jgi:site-specific recombinase XerD
VQSLKKAVATAAQRAGLQRAGIKPVTPHTFRHTFGAIMAQAGTPLRVLCELMRHADIRTTMIYAHLAPHSGREAVGVMDSAFEAVGRKAGPEVAAA